MEVKKTAINSTLKWIRNEMWKQHKNLFTKALHSLWDRRTMLFTLSAIVFHASDRVIKWQKSNKYQQNNNNNNRTTNCLNGIEWVVVVCLLFLAPCKTIIFNRLRIYYQHKSQIPQPAELAVNCEFSLKWPLKLDTNVLSSDRLYFRPKNVLKQLIYGWGLANPLRSHVLEQKQWEKEPEMALHATIECWIDCYVICPMLF